MFDSTSLAAGATAYSGDSAKKPPNSVPGSGVADGGGVTSRGPRKAPRKLVHKCSPLSRAEASTCIFYD